MPPSVVSAPWYILSHWWEEFETIISVRPLKQKQHWLQSCKGDWYATCYQDCFTRSWHTPLFAQLHFQGAFLHIRPCSQDVWVKCTHSLFCECGLPYLYTLPVRRGGCSSCMCSCASPYKLLMHKPVRKHKLVRKHPASPCAQTNLRRGSLLSQPALLPALLSWRPTRRLLCLAKAEGWCQTYSSVKPCFDSQLFPLIGLCLLLQMSMLLLYLFSHYFLLYFRIPSEVPLLLFNQLMLVFLFNRNNSGQRPSRQL